MKAYKFIPKVRKFQLPTVYSFSTAEGETWLWVDSAPGLNRVKILVPLCGWVMSCIAQWLEHCVCHFDPHHWQPDCILLETSRKLTIKKSKYQLNVKV